MQLGMISASIRVGTSINSLSELSNILSTTNMININNFFINREELIHILSNNFDKIENKIDQSIF